MQINRGDFIVEEEEYWPCPECDNQPELIKNSGCYSLQCTGCNRRTDEYNSVKEAELAWQHDILMEYPELEQDTNSLLETRVIKRFPLD